MTRILLILVLFSCNTEKNKGESKENELFQGIERNIELQISSRVDTSNTDVKAVLNLYENYINSQPDSIYDNPYWNSEEKTRYKDFDFSRINIYNGISSSQLFRIYTPFVLSIEPIDEKFQIKVLYSNSATEPPYVGSKVWCIHKLNAIREKGVWKLENALEEKTKYWKKKQVGFIEYVFPREHQFNIERANKALTFCKEIISK